MPYQGSRKIVSFFEALTRTTPRHSPLPGAPTVRSRSTRHPPAWRDVHHFRHRVIGNHLDGRQRFGASGANPKRSMTDP